MFLQTRRGPIMWTKRTETDFFWRNIWNLTVEIPKSWRELKYTTIKPLEKKLDNEAKTKEWYTKNLQR